jgi:hypothetical protein
MIEPMRLGFLSVQRKLYQWSRNNPDNCYRELWNWVTGLRNLRCAWRKIASNRGSRTAGIDGMTVGRVRDGRGSEVFLKKLPNDLRAGRYRPSPRRRKWIPKRVNRRSSDPWAFRWSAHSARSSNTHSDSIVVTIRSIRLRSGGCGFYSNGAGVVCGSTSASVPTGR